MPQELMQLKFESHDVRMQIDEHGDPWWVLADVCHVLAISNSRDAATRLESNEYITVGNTDGNPRAGISHTLTWINEQGLYRLIFRSNKPEAKRFQNWIFGEVLPQIRKTGRYEPESQQVQDPALQAILHQNKQIEAQSRQIEALVIGLDQSRQAAARAQEDASLANSRALEALAAQQWITIRQYVVIHGLTRQLPPGADQQQYGKFLTNYCRDHGLPIYRQQSEQYKEWSYPVWAIQQTLFGWVARRQGQGPIRNLEIEDDGVSWD